MGGFAGKALVTVALFVLFIFVFKAFDDTAEERQAVYQASYDRTQQRIIESYELGETETGLSSPGSGRQERAVDDWGAGNQQQMADDWGE